MNRAMHRSSKSHLGAWDLYQQGNWHLSKLDPVETDKASSLFECAIEVDPTFAAAYTALSAFGEQQRHAQLAFRGAEYFRASGQTLAPLFGCRRGQTIGAEQLLPLTR